MQVRRLKLRGDGSRDAAYPLLVSAEVDELEDAVYGAAERGPSG